MAELSLSMLSLGILALALHLLLVQARTRPYVLPLILTLLPLALISCGALVFSVLPALIYYYIAAIAPAFFMLGPGLWLYTQALTSAVPWYWQRHHLQHYWLVLAAMVVVAQVLLLPEQDRQDIFFSGQEIDSGYPLLVVVSIFVAVLLWLVQSGFYLYKIVRRTMLYRRQLKQVLADTNNKTLHWLSWLVILIAINWSIAVLALLVGNRYPTWLLSEVTVLTLNLLLVWALAYFGLQQQPGFSPIYGGSADNSSESADSITADTAQGKYQRSALADEQAQRIASKLQQAVYQHKLCLDPDLTLYKLAKHLGVSANYVSQTLNQTMQTSFFEYVNSARVEAAKEKLLNNDGTVLEIAMAVGFNARSSFYKAFKASTGMTPGEYQKIHLI